MWRRSLESLHHPIILVDESKQLIELFLLKLFLLLQFLISLQLLLGFVLHLKFSLIFVHVDLYLMLLLGRWIGYIMD